MKTQDDMRVALGNRIRTLRKLKGWTQEELGSKADVDYKFISEIERGNKNPSLQIISKITSALELELSEFFKFEPAKTNRQSVENQLVRILKKIPDDELIKLLGTLRVFYPV